MYMLKSIFFKLFCIKV